MKTLLSLLLFCMTSFVVIQATTPPGKKSPRDYLPGEFVPEKTLKECGYRAFFRISSIPDHIFTLMQGRSYKADCSIPREDLRYIICLHRDISGKALVGEMVVNRKIADAVLSIFEQLFVNRYPIERMRLIDYWDANDEQSMNDNNSSAFNFRFISHTRTVSKHGKGLAVDINTRYNPYHRRTADGKEIIEPASGKPYLDREKDFPYKIKKGDLCYRLFIRHGFRWGGDWKNSKDYQHFEHP